MTTKEQISGYILGLGKKELRALCVGIAMGQRWEHETIARLCDPRITPSLVKAKKGGAS